PAQSTGTTVLLGAGAALLLAGFLAAQRVLPNALMPPAIWRAPDLAAANIAMALLGAAWIPMWYFLNLYLQQGLGFGAFESGAALLPMTGLMMLLMVGVTGRLIGRFGAKRLIVVGLGLPVAGLALLASADADGRYVTDVLPGSLVSAVGMALVFIPAMISAMSGARPQEAGLASGIVNVTYQFGSALGLAVATALTAGTGGYSPAFLAAAAVALGGGVIAAVTLRSPESVPATV
ncbi:MFS transporter, partial [Actinocorallia lasiicapitis]